MNDFSLNVNLFEEKFFFKNCWHLEKNCLLVKKSLTLVNVSLEKVISVSQVNKNLSPGKE